MAEQILKKLAYTIIFVITSANAFSQAKYDSNYINTYYQQKVSLFKLLPTSKKDIVFLGNSITDIGEWSEIWQNKHIKNRGISGDVTFGVLARLNDIVAGKPAKLFIMIGINDIARNIPDSVIVSNYQKMIAVVKAQSPTTQLYLQSILPTNNEFTQFKNHQNKTEHILFINQQLEKICAEQKINFINLYPHFLDETGKLSKTFTNDGLHLTGAGYMQWKKILLEQKFM